MMLENNMPVWHSEYHAIMPAPSEHTVAWLNIKILSQALRKIVPNLGLEVVHQAIGSARPDENQKLNLSPSEDWPLVRQVNIGLPNQAYLYCRVIIPAALYRQEQATFDTLGNRFIGETLLYNQPNVHRSAFEYAALNAQHTLYQEAHATQAVCYARRSLFYLPVLPLLITEVFLHEFPLS